MKKMPRSKIKLSEIEIDYSRDSLFDELGLRRLKDSYLRTDEKSPQERFRYVAAHLGSNRSHAQRLYDYASKHWLSFSTPILSYGTNKRGLPISCYLSYIPDSAEGLVDALQESCWLSMAGGGVGLGLGIRAEDEKSVGVMPHLKVYEMSAMAYRQGKTRRGSYAAYLDISHPNIVQFMDMRKPTGDMNQRCLELHHGVNISDKFMKLVEECMADGDKDDSWPLIDPHNGKVKEVVSARKLWENLLETRHRTGEPYMHFIDASNRGLPAYQKALGLEVKQSNICTEITLATDAKRTAVCCLSSPNLVYWDEWKDNYLFYKDVAEMLDNALTIFIKDAPKTIKRAIYSASQERAIGIGALGFHTLLQKKMIPFDSIQAVNLNRQIFSRYEEHLNRANEELALERGPCPDAAAAGVMQRFSHTRSIAPNATSSIIMGNVSPSIELLRANAYRQDTLSGSFLNKNRVLEALLLKKSKEYSDNALSASAWLDGVWMSIVTNRGSVQHLDCLTQLEKDVFKTASEVDQRWVIKHAADRQKHIDQAQSVNINFAADADIRYLHDVHFDAWKSGLKTLYYCRSDKIFTGDSISKGADRHQFDFSKPKSEESTCVACEG